jgi:hypothetical protein
MICGTSFYVVRLMRDLWAPADIWHQPSYRAVLILSEGNLTSPKRALWLVNLSFNDHTLHILTL